MLIKHGFRGFNLGDKSKHPDLSPIRRAVAWCGQLAALRWREAHRGEELVRQRLPYC
jgi:hypothetical protein